MRFHVNEDCIGCGLCADTCPEVFTMDGDAAAAKTGDVPEELLKSALSAKDDCPAGAIESEE